MLTCVVGYIIQALVRINHDHYINFLSGLLPNAKS